MARIDLHDTPFTGESRSVTYLRTAKPPGCECGHCGSSLAGRYQGVRFIGGKAKRVWTCGCGHDRRVDMEAAA